MSLGKFDLPLYLSEQVPPNTLQLYAPAPKGSPAITPLPAEQNILISLDIRHFYNLIDIELKTLRETELRGLSKANFVDLTEDEFNPNTLDIPFDKLLFVETLVKFVEIALKLFLLWDWNPNSDYYNKDSIIYDAIKSSYLEMVKLNYIPNDKDSRLPDIRDILS